MKENIKILKSLIEDLKREEKLIGYNAEVEIQAIENLIKGYRELEKENKKLKEYIVVAPNLDEMTATKYSYIQREAYFKGRAEEQQKAEQIIYEHYIPKSKVKERIEELNKNELLCKMNFENIKFTIEVLQELMEDK